MSRSQAQLRRLYWIDAALQQGDYPNGPALAREMSISAGTLHHDLRILREKYRAPLTYDPTRGGFGYGHPFRPELPPLPLEDAIELAAALLGRSRLGDCVLGDSLRRWRERLAELVPGPDGAPSPGPPAGGAAPGRVRPERAAARRRGDAGGARAKEQGDAVSIRLRFDPAGARSALDSGLFAPREVQLLTGGGFEATVTTSDPDTFLLSLLQWAPHFAVAGPPWARQRLPQLLRRALRQIEGRKPQRRKRQAPKPRRAG